MLTLTESKAEELKQILVIKDHCIEKMQKSGNDFWNKEYPNEALFKSNIKGRSLFSIYTSNKLIGSICISKELEDSYRNINWKFSRHRTVNRLMISPKYQGMGYAKKAMLITEDYSRNDNAESIRLAVYENNHVAKFLYESLGYLYRSSIELRMGIASLYEKKI